MLRRTERILENIPVGSLGLISLTGCEELGKKVDDYLVNGDTKAEMLFATILHFGI